MKFKQWLDVWLEDFVRPSMKSRTYKRYLVAVRTHIARILGDEELQELSAIKLQNFVAALTTRERTLSPGSVNNIISVMQGALKRAYLIGVIDEYVGDKIVRPRAEEKRVQCFTQAEQRRIEAAAKADGKDENEQRKDIWETVLVNVKAGDGVTHKKFGDGTITWIGVDKKYLKVKFAVGEKQFIFPDAFVMGFLSLK